MKYLKTYGKTVARLYPFPSMIYMTACAWNGSPVAIYLCFVVAFVSFGSILSGFIDESERK